jgi:hypothetical protein
MRIGGCPEEFDRHGKLEVGLWRGPGARLMRTGPRRQVLLYLLCLLVLGKLVNGHQLSGCPVEDLVEREEP